MTPRKLDKSHGFMQSIIKNQVLRDEYDKEQKLELATSKKKDQQILKNERLTGTVDKETKRNRTSRREAKQLYVPPHMKRQGAVENGEQSDIWYELRMAEDDSDDDNHGGDHGSDYGDRDDGSDNDGGD
ncbi:Hypothetical predicted protein [Paramuricea clavata]|uniref:Uncharacterized protein n=1 Tax=Paramuricea clavata TaxID=317549 RepID=A0A6S7FRU2_PARCT|nr:Hypothetical predicted protein [Paramuricea clavata]